MRKLWRFHLTKGRFLAVFFRSYTGLQDVQLTELEINIALESINNALKTPLAVTQSQYTEAPEGYVAK